MSKVVLNLTAGYGSVVVDGVDLSNVVRSVSLDHDAGGIPCIQLTLMSADLVIEAAEANVEFRLTKIPAQPKETA